jgi:hypothetical protein
MLLKRQLTALALLALPCVSQAAFWTPHAGIDAKFWGVRNKTPGNQNFDYEKIFPRIEDGFSVYVGSRVNGYFGFDVGYEQSVVKSRSYEYIGGELVFAVPEAARNASDTHIRLRSGFLDLNFYWEVLRQFEVLFIVGTALVTPQAHIMHLTASTGTWLEYREDVDPKWMGRFGLGAQYNIMPCLGIKASIMWEPTNRIDYVGYDENNNFFDVHPYTHATMVNLGIVYSIGNPRRHVVEDTSGW